MHTLRLIGSLCLVLLLLVVMQHALPQKSLQKISPLEVKKETVSPSPQVTIDTLQDDWHELLYPGAIVENMTIKQVLLHTSDEDFVVADWYKEKLSRLGYGSNNFMHTTDNGNEKYIYTVSNKSNFITLTIEKKNKDGKTNIILVKSK